MTIIFASLAFTCMVTFTVTVCRNVIKNKSIAGWLLPEGATKIEKVLLGASFSLVLVFAILGATWGQI